MRTIRRSTWFATLALTLAIWIGTLWCVPSVAEAILIPSHGAEAGDLRGTDVAKVQTFLERKEVLQKLLDFGVSPEDAMVKIQSMSNNDLHRLASLTDRMPAGTDAAEAAVIALVVVIFIIVVLILLNKKVIVR